MPAFQYEPCGDGAMRHFGVPSAFMTGRPGFTMSAVKAVYQKICWAILPCDGTGPDSEKVMPCACGGLFDRQVSRLDEEICPAAGARHDLLRIRPGAVARQYRPADLLVHRLYRRHGEARPAGHECGRYADCLLY